MASASKKPKLEPPARPTRSNTVSSDDWHSSNSKMHKAIEARDLAINKLLDSGETFCIGDGLNCFILAALRLGRGQTTIAHWQFVKKMLELDPRGLSAKFEDGLTLLMIFSNCPEKIRHLVSLGADINAVDKNGHSVLMRSYKNPGFGAVGFAELLKLGADPNVPPNSPHPNLFEYMFKMYRHLDRTAKEAAGQCISFLAQPQYSQKINKSHLCPHPIFSLIDEHCNNRKGLVRFRSIVSFFGPLKYLPKCHLLIKMSSSHFHEDHNSKEWEHLRSLWKIPDTFLLDPLSYYYFNTDMCCLATSSINELREITSFLVKTGLVVSDNKQVLPPGLALMYNTTQRAFSADAYWQQFRRIGTYCSCILLQNDVPRMLQDGDRILKMMAPFISEIPPLSLVQSMVVELMPTLPYHPFTTINNLVEDLSLLMIGDLKKEILQSRIKAFAENLIPVVRSKFISKSLKGNENDLWRLRNDIFSDIKVDLIEEMEHHAVEVSSLLDICSWRVREELYIYRKEGQDLNSCIQELCDRRLVPPTLHKYLIFDR